MKRLITAGATDQTVYVFIMDSASTTGGGKTGLAYNTGSLVCYYVRDLGSATALTLATQTVTGAHSDGGFVEVDATNMPGIYRLDLSDAVCAASVNNVVVMLKGAAGMVPLPLEIQLGGGQIATLTGHTAQTGDAYARLGAPAGASASADIAAIKAETALIQAKTTNLPAAPASTTNITAAAGCAVSSIGANVITATSINADAITAAKIAAGAIDNATFAADVGSTAYATNIIALAADKAIANAALATAANLAAVAATLGNPDFGTLASDNAENHILLGGIDAKTTNLPAAPASTTNITAASGVTLAATTGLGNQTANITGNLSGSVGSVTGAVGSVTGAVGSVTGAVGSVTGAVGSVTGNVGGNVTGSVGSVATGGIAAASFAAGAINAAAIAADAITDAKVASDVTIASVTGAVGSVTGAVGSVTGNVGGNVTGSVGSVVGAVGSVTGLTASDVGAIKAKTDNLPAAPAAVGDIPSAAAVASQVRTELTTELGRIDVATSTRLATAGYTAPLDAAGTRTAVGLATANLDTQLTAIDDYLDTEVAAIKAKTDLIPAEPASTTNITAATGIDITKILGTAISTPATAGILDVNVKNFKGSTAVGGATPGLPDARLAEISLGGGIQLRLNVGLTTADLDTQLAALPTAAEIADANWDEAMSGHLAAGTTGKALSDAGAAGTPLDAAGVRAAVGLASANLDTQLADLPTAAENADANWDEARSGHVAAGSFGEGVKVDSIADAAITADSIDYGAIQDDKIHNATYIEMGAKAAQLTWQSLSADYAPAGGFYVADSMGEQMTHLDADVSSAGGGLDAAGVRSAIGLASANLDTQLGTIDDFLDTEVAAIKAKTDNLPAAPAAVGDIPSAATVASQVRTELTTELGRIDVATSTRLATAGYTAPLDAAGTRTAVGLATANLDTQLTAIDDLVDTEIGAIKAKTDLIPASPAAVGSAMTLADEAITDAKIAELAFRGKHFDTDVEISAVTGAVGSVTAGVTVTTNNDKTGYTLTSGERNSVADALLDRADAIATGITLREAVEVAVAALAGKLSGVGTATITIRDIADTKNVIVATVSAGNRTAVTITP